MVEHKGFYVRVEADTINILTGDRLTTFVVKAPRCLLAEMNTHRSWSRNYSSSRAIPLKTMISDILEDPYVPEYVYKNKPGMQGDELLNEEEMIEFRNQWLDALNDTISRAETIDERLSVHKQTINRLLEPWMWANGVVSFTDHANFFALRTHKDAEPHFQKLARMMWDAREASTPKGVLPWDIDMILNPDDYYIHADDYHLPFGDYNPDTTIAIKRAVARCARASYNNFYGKNDVESDIALYDKLVAGFPKHASPLEHIAFPCTDRVYRDYRSNFTGFVQYRKLIKDENIKEFYGYK